MNESTNHEELYTFIRQSEQANELDTRLKSLPNVDEILMRLHRQDEQNVNLLMLAALYGKDEMVRVILLHSSNVSELMELHGSIVRTNGTLVRNATALWCACDRGHYTVARTLIEIGWARIDHGPRYPLLIDAVVVGRLDTVRFLIDNDYASVNNTRNIDNYKLNSLIMAVIHGCTDIVAFLLEKGAKFEYTTLVSNNTPLGYAAVKGHLDIVRLLCSAGANPSTKNKGGQTPLMLAAGRLRIPVVDYLLELNDIETGINELELVACSFVTTLNSSIPAQHIRSQRMLCLLRKVFELRRIKNLPKPISQSIAAYAFERECQTIEELNQIQHNYERLCVEALMIRERLLVPERNEALFKPILIHGDKLVEKGQYEQCLHLWEHTFHLYQNMDLETGLHRFVWLFCKMLTNQIPISAQRFVQISQLTFEPSQQKPRDDFIKNALCLFAVAAKLLEQSTLTHAERHLIYQWIKDLARQKRQTSFSQTLLHLTVSVQTHHDINYRSNDIKPILSFPNLAIAQLLLTQCYRWIDVNAKESQSGNTALHIASRSGSVAVAQFLLNSGAHIDAMNMYEQTPLDVARTVDMRTLFHSKQTPPRLKCLCARLIMKKELSYKFLWPEETDLNRFLFLHGGLIKEKYVDSPYELNMDESL